MNFEAMILNRQANADLAETGGVNFEDDSQDWEKIADGPHCKDCGFNGGQHSIACKGPNV